MTPLQSLAARAIWLTQANSIITKNFDVVSVGDISMIEVFRDSTGLPHVSYYGLLSNKSFEWYMGVQFTDDTAATVRRISFGAGVVGADDDLNSFTVYTEVFHDTLRENVLATLRNERLDKTV